jgi:hypothetical protein
MDDSQAEYLRGEIAALETALLCAIGLVQAERMGHADPRDAFTMAADVLGAAIPEAISRAEDAGLPHGAAGFESRMERIIERLRRGDCSVARG